MFIFNFEHFCRKLMQSPPSQVQKRLQLLLLLCRQNLKPKCSRQQMETEITSRVETLNTTRRTRWLEVRFTFALRVVLIANYWSHLPDKESASKETLVTWSLVHVRTVFLFWKCHGGLWKTFLVGKHQMRVFFVCLSQWELRWETGRRFGTRTLAAIITGTLWPTRFPGSCRIIWLTRCRAWVNIPTGEKISALWTNIRKWRCSEASFWNLCFSSVNGKDTAHAAYVAPTAAPPAVKETKSKASLVEVHSNLNLLVCSWRAAPLRCFLSNRRSWRASWPSQTKRRSTKEWLPLSSLL